MEIINKASIRDKLIVINSIVVLLVIGITTIVFLNYAKKEFILDLTNTGHVMSYGLAYNSTLPLLTRDADSAKKNLDALLRNKDVVYAALYFKDLSLMTYSLTSDAEHSQYVDIKKRIKRVEKSYSEIIQVGDHSHIILIRPVTFKKMGKREEIGLGEDLFLDESGVAEVIGYAVVTLTSHNLIERFAKTSSKFIYISLFVFISGIAIIIFLLNKFLMPLSKLSLAAERVSRGDLDSKIDIKSYDEIGQLSSSFNHMIDKLKEMILELEERATEVENLFEGAMEGILLLDENLRIIRANKVMANNLGYYRKSLLGKGFNEIISSSELDALKNEIIKGDGLVLEILFCNKSGDEIPFEVSFTAVSIGGGKMLLAFARNISMRKKMESQILQSERLAATGRLAADVAHEVNNPLGIIKNYLYMIRRDLEDKGEKDFENVDVIRDEINRIAEIVKGLLAFSKPDLPARYPVNINDTINNTMILTRKMLEFNNIKSEIVLDESIPHIKISEGHLKQVILNIITNAKDAMPDGGRLKIMTALMKDSLEIVIEDDGEGISEETLKDVFNPFYTTKGVKGTGLGLSVSYGIVRKYGGEIILENRKEGGIRARLIFPYKDTGIKPAKEVANV